MKKLQSKQGFTLVEVLTGLLILVFLVVGMGTGMDAGSRVYQESVFETNSATLAGILNTALGDVLRHSERVSADTNPVTFTSYDYGLENAYLTLPLDGMGNPVPGMILLKGDSTAVELVNAGAYPGLQVTELTVTYEKPSVTARGGYFEISYTIQSTEDESLERNVTTVVRRING